VGRPNQVPTKIPVDEIVTVRVARAPRGFATRRRCGTPPPAGLEEPNAKGAKGAEGGADADAEMEVDNLAAGGGFFGWMGREQLGAGAGG